MPNDAARQEAEAVLEAIRRRRKEERERKEQAARDEHERQVNEAKAHIVRVLAPQYRPLAYYYTGNTRPYGRRGTSSVKPYHYVYQFEFPGTLYPLWMTSNREGRVEWLLEEPDHKKGQVSYQVYRTIEEALERIDKPERGLTDINGIPL